MLREGGADLVGLLQAVGGQREAQRHAAACGDQVHGRIASRLHVMGVEVVSVLAGHPGREKKVGEGLEKGGRQGGRGRAQKRRLGGERLGGEHRLEEERRAASGRMEADLVHWPLLSISALQTLS